MRSYIAQSLGDVLDAFSSNQPVPGGGSAAALAGALGVSLLMMVAGLPRTRNDSPEDRADLDEAALRLQPLRVALGTLIDRDAAAYGGVVEAYRLPKETPDQSATRRRAIADAMRVATETPLETMRVCQQALSNAWVVASRGARSAACDAAVGIELLLTALRGAALNVDVNLNDVADENFVRQVKAERRQLEDSSVSEAERARAHLSVTRSSG